LFKGCKTREENNIEYVKRNVVEWRFTFTPNILFMGRAGSKLGDKIRNSKPRKTHF
jgi:hypothetical protein